MFTCVIEWKEHIRQHPQTRAILSIANSFRVLCDRKIQELLRSMNFYEHNKHMTKRQHPSQRAFYVYVTQNKVYISNKKVHFFEAYAKWKVYA